MFHDSNRSLGHCIRVLETAASLNPARAWLLLRTERLPEGVTWRWELYRQLRACPGGFVGLWYRGLPYTRAGVEREPRDVADVERFCRPNLTRR